MNPGRLQRIRYDQTNRQTSQKEQKHTEYQATRDEKTKTRGEWQDPDRKLNCEVAKPT